MGLAAEQRQLTWGITAFPLLLLQKGEQSSAEDKPPAPLEAITQRLPEYSHHLMQMNVSRALVELEKRDDLCVVGLQRNAERDKLGYFIPLFISLPPQLVIRSSDEQTFSNGQPSVSLVQLLQRSDLRGAILAGRNYGPQLMPILQKAQEQGRLQLIQTSGSGSNLLDMLRHKRIDYALEYAETLQVMQTIDEMRPIVQSLSLLPLQETTKPIISGIYCSRTEQGKRLADQIERIAREPEVIEYYRAASQSITPEASRRHYRGWFEDYYNTRATRDWTNQQE